jgi:hypothetical protein
VASHLPARIPPASLNGVVERRRTTSRASRALASVESRTLLRAAIVQSEGLVEAENLREVDRLAHTAMNGQAFLRGWANHLAGEDPMVADELRFFTDLAKLGKGEIIADAIDSFRRR